MGRWPLGQRPIVYLLMAVLASACAAWGPAKPRGPQGQRNLLTRDEILESTAHQGDLLNAIHSLRPNFLAAPHGALAGSATASAPIAVYVDRIRQSGLDALRSISASKVVDVRYLDPTTSLNELGPVASGGALLVRMFDPSKSPSGSLPY